MCNRYFTIFLFFNDTATTEIYTLSLHDALPIFNSGPTRALAVPLTRDTGSRSEMNTPPRTKSWIETWPRSEEHTSELQSHSDLVCRLLLEKKKNKKYNQNNYRILEHT